VLCRREVSDREMKPPVLAIVALFAVAAALLWLLRLPDPPEVKEMLALIVCAFIFGLVPELLPWSSPKSTMGQRGDGLIGFEAEVGGIEPLRVEAQGSVWQARLIGGGSVRVGMRVRVIDREGLTLLVQASAMSGETA